MRPSRPTEGSTIRIESISEVTCTDSSGAICTLAHPARGRGTAGTGRHRAHVQFRAGGEHPTLDAVFAPPIGLGANLWA